MAITVNTNIASLSVQGELAVNSNRMTGAIGRLSSGLRINGASDDAAGLALSEKMRAQIRSLQMAQRNGADGISLANTADGAMNEISALLIRMRELGVQSLNGTNNTSERAALDIEFQSLLSEISRIADSTVFGGSKILAGGAAMEFQVGTGTLAIDRVAISTANMTIAALSVAGKNIQTNVTTIRIAVNAIDGAIGKVNTTRSKYGASINRLNTTVAILGNLVLNTAAAESRIRDADIAMEAAEFTRSQILQQAGVAVLAQANMIPQAAVQLLRF